MEKAIKKSIASALLLAILLFSFMAYVNPLVSADPIGIGKFVSVNIVGGVDGEDPGNVTLLKLSSGETWVFPLTDTGDNNIDLESNRVKVGAGNVQLIAKANSGFQFSRWEDEYGTTIKVEDPHNVYEFKTSKGTTTITAVFQLITCEIEYYVLTDGGKISLTEAGEKVEAGKIEVAYGGNQKFWFYPDDEEHFVSAILVDGEDSKLAHYVAPVDSGFGSWYEFENVTADHSLAVSFSKIGEPIIIPGNVPSTLFVGAGASLTFDNSTGGTANATQIFDFPVGTAYLIWDIHNTANDTVDGKVTITFYSEVGNLTEVIVASSLNASYCDVIPDGIINGGDVSAVANAVKSTTPNSDEINPLYDVNNDGKLTEDDVHRVNEYKWETVLHLEPTLISFADGIYYYEVEIDHFSVFRCR